MNAQHTDNQLAQIEHELEILRTRYAILQRWWKITAPMLAIFPVTFGGLLVYALVSDPLFGAFMVFFVLVVFAFFFLLNSIKRLPFTSEWEAIEDMIAVREKRLAE